MTADRTARPLALTIAGSDSGGGAGIQADLKTFSALGVYGMTAITAITVQNTKGVYGYEAMAPQLVDEQIRAVTTDIGVDAAKTGMLATAGIVRRWPRSSPSWRSRTWSSIPCSSRSTGMSCWPTTPWGSSARGSFPLAALVTPNLPEASGLGRCCREAKDDMRRAPTRSWRSAPGRCW
jgi:hydroxymethylpyrimidine/phosphomethylpyrimidine kinase